MNTEDIINMSADQLRVALLEESIAGDETNSGLWVFTSTEQGCLNFVDAMHDAEQSYKNSGDKECFEIVHFCRDLAFAKGNLFALRRRQSYQLREAQQAFVGEL